jgi:colanic acid/amylovoran biosynthesis glycosyltransferase
MPAAMNCLYLASVYPCLSETFIARELKYLSRLGWNIKVFRIRGGERLTRNEASVPEIRLSPVMLNPLYWIRGIIWALQYRKQEFAEIRDQVRRLDAKLSEKIKIFVILLTSLGIAEHIEKTKLSFDHIRAHFLHTEALSAYWLAKLLRVPYSITAHTRMIYYPRPLVKKIVENASFCVGISEETVNLLRRFRNNGDAVYLIRNGIEIGVWNPKGRTISSAPLILAVGRLIPKKGFDILIKACATLKQRGTEFTCRVVGTGIQNNHLARLIIENDLGGQVQLLGALPFEDVIGQYEQATVLVAPSRICQDDVDGLPTVIIEALGRGVPIIATPIAGIPDLIKDNETGLIVPPDDQETLANVIGKLLADKKIQVALALEGQKQVVDNFDISKTIKYLHAAMLDHLALHS